ncbi:putative quinol monooxygenase [Halocynthiibacter sp. C4]|uniref:putative quinol monooxygenase n=1 Tax=Halocynthiibacter sp. C4 TaxID=2992758 RepID=UPI00237A2978|nr:putative quinol monooxygenase [Halocynthiibacter sp. C4]MDE0589450.1 putative quinol monooxygenase [Halocynthiibacter sp. C4]
MLTIIAHIHANTDAVDQVKSELQKMVAPTLAEKGCIAYDLHQNNDDPTHFFFYETWETRDLWQDHMNSAHIAAFKAATEGLVREVSVFELSKVPHNG